jgi:hypothetical protein
MIFAVHRVIYRKGKTAMSKIVTWLRHVAAIEPVYVRSYIGAIVTGATAWGLELGSFPGRVETTLQQAIILAGLTLTVMGVRDRVTPSAAVVARVDDPRELPAMATYLAGGYSEVPTGAMVGRLSSLDTLTRIVR